MTSAAVAGGVALVVAYLLAEGRLHRRGDAWPVRRSAAAAGAGFAAVAAGLVDAGALPVGPAADVVAHLLLTMLAPLLLALAAPVTLLLRVVGVRARRVVLVLLHSRWARLVTCWPLLLVAQVGGACAYYLSPLVHELGWLHAVLMAHMVLGGWVFSTWLAGADPLPGRPGVVARALVLLAASAAHDVLAKVLFARGGGVGAQLLSYGGDAVGVATAVALFAGWYARAGRAAAHARRRALTTPAGRPC